MRVIEHGSGAPIEGAHVSLGLRRRSPEEAGATSTRWTDSDGGCTFEGDEAALREGDQFLVLRVEHPLHGAATKAWRDRGEVPVGDRGPLTLTLGRVATAQGRVTWAGAAPGEPYHVIFKGQGAALRSVPLVAVTGPDGSYRRSALPAGKYTVIARPRRQLTGVFGLDEWADQSPGTPGETSCSSQGRTSC